MNGTCCVCLLKDFLIPLTDANPNNETIYSKLRSVVPEVQWKDSFCICSTCSRTLDVVVEFRKLCLKSSLYRLKEQGNNSLIVSIGKIEGNYVKYKETSNDGDIDVFDDNKQLSEEIEEPRNSEKSTEMLSKIYNIQYKSPEHLFAHNKEIHKTTITCLNHFQSSPNESELINHKRNHEYNSRIKSINEEVNDIEIRENAVNHEDINRSQYNCEKCNDTFPTENQYEEHKKNHQVFICFHCNKPYKSKVMLVKHIKVLHDNREIECFHCGVICKNESLLKKHYKEIHDISDNINNQNNLFKCNKCEKSYKNEKIKKNHFKTCDGIKRHSKLNFSKDFVKNRCEICGRFYTTEKILKAHMKTCIGPKVKMDEDEINCYLCDTVLISDKLKLEHVLNEHNVNLNRENTCQHCYKQFSNPEEYKDHLLEVHSDDILKREKRSYSCEVCSKIFRYVKDVIEHCVKEHQMDSKLVKPFLCAECGTRFTSSPNMIQHKQYHEGTRSHICSFCGKSYITKSDLIVHEYIHLNRRNYKCEFCDRAFNTNKNLRSHKLVVHTDSSLWKYHCDMCSKRFPLKSGYDEHIRRHAGDKRFRCLICSKSFISSSELRKHMNFHSNVKTFKCSHCDKEYKDHRYYEIHLKKVHGIGNANIPIRTKKFACHLCPSKFFDKQKLSRHLCTHTGIKPYGCTICEKRYTDKSYLKNHLKVAHNVVEVQDDDMGNAKIMQVI